MPELITAYVKQADLTEKQLKILESIKDFREDLRGSTISFNGRIEFNSKHKRNYYPYSRDSLYINNRVDMDDINFTGKTKTWYTVDINGDQVSLTDKDTGNIIYQGKIDDLDGSSQLSNKEKVVLNLLKWSYQKQSFPIEGMSHRCFNTFALAYHNNKGDELIIFPGGMKFIDK